MEKMQNAALYESENGKIYCQDFVNAIRKTGIRKGDAVFAHSSVSAFGKLCTSDRNFLLQSLTDSLKECVGDEGMIIMPTFTYSFDKNQTYDADNTKSTVGILTEFFRKQKDVKRTLHPNHSVAVWGKHKEDLLNIGKDTFDDDSIFGKLHKLNGKIVFLGAPFQSCTFAHYIEQKHNVPYRRMSRFRGKIISHGKAYDDEITFYNRYSFFFNSFARFEHHLLDKGLMKTVKVGDGNILMVESSTMFKEGCKLLDDDKYYFLKNEPFIFKIFNIFIYPFLKYAPWLIKILDKIAYKIIYRKAKA